MPSLSAEKVQLKVWSVWPGKVTAPAGDGPDTRPAAPVLPATIAGTDGASPATDASPELVTVRTAVNVFPSGRVGAMAITAVNAEGFCTTTPEDTTTLALTGLPSVTSVPPAPAASVTAPAAAPS